MFELFRTAGFRLAFTLSVSFTALTLVLFSFIYWQATHYQVRRTDAFLVGEEHRLASQSQPQVVAAVGARRTEGIHRLTVSALFSADGLLLAGNLDAIPRHLSLDGRPHSLRLIPSSEPDRRPALVRTVAYRVPGGNILVVGRSLDETIELRQVVFRSLLLGVIPAVFLTLGLSALVSWRALRQVKAIDETIARIIQGQFGERLPSLGTKDSFGRLVTSVNGLLDKIAVLLDDLHGVGNNIAHDLRTPLARVRARLERCRAQYIDDAHLVEALDQVLVELDHASSIIAALLRIGEIEDRQRRAGFTEVSVASLTQDLFEVYQPVAEQQNIILLTQVDPTMVVYGDWDLLTEALVNLIENALKFTPGGGSVRLMGYNDSRGAILRVADTGPGIPEAEREAVFMRFYSAKPSHAAGGSGLGLSLVLAICRLHGFSIHVVDGPPGCVIEIICGIHARELTGLSAVNLDMKREEMWNDAAPES